MRRTRSPGTKQLITNSPEASPKAHPQPLPREGREPPPPPPKEGSCELARNLFARCLCSPPSEGVGEVSRVGGGSQILGGLPAGSLLEGGRTTYQHLIKIKIHFMINLLVCVALPVSRKTSPHPPPKEGEKAHPGSSQGEGKPSLRAMIDNVIMN